jgi:hypothetical protein
MNLLLRYIPLILLAVLFRILLKRRAYKFAPYFFAYVTFGVAAGLVRFIVHDRPGIYFETYWITEAGYDILGILVMYEVVHLTAGTLVRARASQLILFTLLIIGIALSLVHSHSVPPKVDGIRLYIVLAEIAVRFVQVLVFAGLATLVPLIGLRWRQYPFGVATGFGLYATVMLLTTIKFSDFGTRFKLLWGWTSLVAYSLAVLIWIWFFSVPQKIENPVPELSAPSPGDLKKYKDALRRMR